MSVQVSQKKNRPPGNPPPGETVNAGYHDANALNEVGLNPFACTLVAESFQRSLLRKMFPENPVCFIVGVKDGERVRITLEMDSK